MDVSGLTAMLEIITNPKRAMIINKSDRGVTLKVKRNRGGNAYVTMLHLCDYAFPRESVTISPSIPGDYLVIAHFENTTGEEECLRFTVQ